jgi:hypothetical protein
MPPKKEVQTIRLGVSSKQVFVSGKEHLGTHGWNIGMNNPTFKAGAATLSPSTRISRFMDVTDSDQYKPKEVYLKYFEKEKPKSTATVLKDFTIPESTRIVRNYGGEATADRYPKDLTMMMGVVAKMVSGSIPAFWWCIGLPFLRGSSQPAEVVVITDIKKFYTERWAAEKEEKEAALNTKKKSSVQEIDEGEEDASDYDESSGEEDDSEESEEEESDDDDDDDESEEEVLDDSSGDEVDSGSDDEEVAPVSKRAQKKGKKSKKSKESKDESDSEEPELPPSDSEDEPVSKLMSKKDKARKAAKEAAKEEKKAKEATKAKKKAKAEKKAKEVKKAKKKAKAAEEDAEEDAEEGGEEDGEEGAEEGAEEDGDAMEVEEEREIPETVDIFDHENGANGTYYIDKETLGQMLDKIVFMYPYNIDIQLGFSKNGLPYREGEKQRVELEGGDPIEIGQRKPGEEGDVPYLKPEHPGEGASKDAMDKYNAKLNMWEGAPYIKTKIHHSYFGEVRRSPWDILVMQEVPDPIKKAVKEFVLSHNMAERCPQLAHMSDYRAGHSFPWAKFIQADQQRIAGVDSPQRKYSIELQQRFHDEIVVHDGTLYNRDGNGKPIDEGDRTTKTIPWMRKVMKEGYKDKVQDYTMHGRHAIDLTGRPDDLSPDQHQIAWNVEAMLGKIGTKRLAHITGLSEASSSGAKAQPAKPTPKSQQPAAKAQASAKAIGKRKADESVDLVAVADVPEDEGMIIFSQPGIREGMADADLILEISYTDAEGSHVTHNIPTDKSFSFIVRKKARKSIVKGGVLAIQG